jgi:hypothetical protein
MPIEKICLNCGEKFIADRKRRKYCSTSCVYNHNKDNKTNHDEIIELYVDKGLSTTEVGKRTGYTSGQISKILRKNGINARPRGYYGLTIREKNEKKYQDKILDLYLNKDYSIKEIRNELNIGTKLVQSTLKRNKISKRIPDHVKEAWINKYLVEKQSASKIAKEFNCANLTVIRYLKKNNIKIRPFNTYQQKEKNPRWEGGISFEPYCSKFNNEFKERVRDFWDHKCGICGKLESQNKRKLDVHHVNYEKMVCCDDTPPLFMALCIGCHTKTTNNKYYWESVLTEYIMIYFDGNSYFSK